MECEKARELIQEETRRVLTPQEANAVERHVKACSACRKERSDITGVVNLLNRLPVPKVPSNFFEGIRIKMDRVLRLLTWQTVVFAIGLFIFIVGFIAFIKGIHTSASGEYYFTEGGEVSIEFPDQLRKTGRNIGKIKEADKNRKLMNRINSGIPINRNKK